MDSGASSHMASDHGNFDSLIPSASQSVTVGNGATLPITHIGSYSLTSTSIPLYLRKILIVPQIIKNLVSVRRLTRENPITVEFDSCGFSLKDARSRMVLHRCDSPDELYPVHPPSSPDAAPIALSAGVDL